MSHLPQIPSRGDPPKSAQQPNGSGSPRDQHVPGSSFNERRISSSQNGGASVQLTPFPDPSNASWKNQAYHGHDRKDQYDQARIDQHRVPTYFDRDDPRCARSGHAGPSRLDQYERKRKSRSPQPQHPSQSYSKGNATMASDRKTPWADLRQPVSEPRPPHTASAASMSTPTKPTASSISTTATSKRFATDISKWNQKQAELHASDPRPDDSQDASSNPSFSSRGGQPDHGLNPAQMLEADLRSFDYKDEARIACLLCQRKFKALDTLHRHTNESQLHKDNLEILDTCRQGVFRKRESLSDPVASSTTLGGEQQAAATPASDMSDSAHPQTTATPMQYRDRASERRAVFGADKSVKIASGGNAQKVFEGPKAPVEETPISAPEKPIESDNIGSKLLAMMGWTQGQGLGANGAGRTEIVETKVYKPGAGLGSSTPTDTATHEARSSANATRKPGNVAFTGYLDKAKDGARQRLAEHSQQPPS